jgi:putative ABC transport system substrate-binding protein
VLLFNAENDPLGQSDIAEFQQALKELGWTEGRNVTIDYRWGRGDPERYRAYASELVALSPDVLLGSGPTARALQQATHVVPIVFAGLNDPVGSGVVASLARPGGNITGFAITDYSTNGKLAELLKEIAPRVTRAAVIRDPTGPAGQGNLGAIQAAAVSMRMEVRPVDARDAGEIERGLASLAREPNGGLIVPGSAQAFLHRELIVKLAALHRLPAVYGNRLFVAEGGLAFYGPVDIDPFRRVAGYVDRILRGEKPADLPVQAPTKYETVLNLKTAKALGIEVPTSILVRADEVIE